MLYDSQLEACLKPQTLPITTHVTKAISLFKILGISYFVCLFAYFCFAMFFFQGRVSLYSWMSWTLFCRPGRPLTNRDLPASTP